MQLLFRTLIFLVSVFSTVGPASAEGLTVTDIVLNLKGLAVAMDNEGSKRLSLHAVGPGVVTAADIADRLVADVPVDRQPPGLLGVLLDGAGGGAPRLAAVIGEEDGVALLGGPPAAMPYAARAAHAPPRCVR